MKRYWMLTAAVLAVGLGYVLLSQSAPAAPAEGPAWEYRVLMRHDVLQHYSKMKHPDGADEADGMRAALTELINPLGAEGWELVTSADGEFIFKRSPGGIR